MVVAAPARLEVVVVGVLPAKVAGLQKEAAVVLLEVHTLPLYATAASFVPSAEEVIAYHLFVAPTVVQVAPLLLEVHMLPSYTAAASFVPSSEEVIPYHCFVAPTEVSFVQVAPLSLEVHMLPPLTVAASFVPSSEEVIEVHLFVALTEVSFVQTSPAAAADPWSALSSKIKQMDKRVFMARMVKR